MISHYLKEDTHKMHGMLKVCNFSYLIKCVYDCENYISSGTNLRVWEMTLKFLMYIDARARHKENLHIIQNCLYINPYTHCVLFVGRGV